MHLKIKLLSVGVNKILDKYLNLLYFLPKLLFAIKMPKQFDVTNIL